MSRLTAGLFFKIRRLLVRALRYRFNKGRFGIKEALVFCYSVDVWQRYSHVAKAILGLSDGQSGKRLSVLDVGGGSGEIAHFLVPTEYDCCILDMSCHHLNTWKDSRVSYIQGSGTSLPFRDSTFDVVVSVDTLEHISGAQKATFISELKRVARRQVVVHAPAKSTDGVFVADEYDQNLDWWMQRVYHFGDTNTSEHLLSGVPSVEDLQRAFPGAQPVGTFNAKTWYLVMRLERLPLLNLFTGFLYLALQKRSSCTAPYYACLLSWPKTTGSPSSQE